MKFLLFGIVQGMTEFLPISSSGHLFLLKRFFNIEENILSFFVFLHLATLCAIFVYLHQTIRRSFSDKRLWLNISIITIVTGAVALGINRFSVTFFEHKYFIPCCLLGNAGILLSLRRRTSSSSTPKNLTPKDALLMGLLQGLAFLPGISRSGITIVGLIKRKFQLKEAFSLSFLMAIPVIFAAFLFKTKELIHTDIAPTQLLVGFTAAFGSGFLALRIIKSTLLNNKFRNFGYYSLILAVLTLLV